ncbi:MAG: ABC transporter ATP-binding protein [Planctomycetes bacterium]|nr:ABC transporter ATP-binding protein [Planctomycetota bacterium]
MYVLADALEQPGGQTAAFRESRRICYARNTVGVITAQHLSHSYGRRMAIEAVTFRVEPGTIYGFLGPNGAGKTTTIRILLGFLRPRAGSARVLGLDCWREGPRIKRDVGYLPGDLRLYPWMNGRSALAIVGRVRGHDLRPTGLALAERFRLDMNVRVRKMSRGMRQKLGLILVLAHEPRLLILDEPTSGLDPIMRETLGDYLRERAAAGTTVFFSSHTLSEVERLCDHVAIVRAGRLVADESLDALRVRAGREVTIDFDDAEAAGVEPPPFLAVERRDQTRWTGSLTGATPDLLGWLHGRPVRDLAIGPPDLDSMFRRYYEDEPEGNRS